MKNVPFVLFIFSLVFAPLAFGTAEQWSLFFLEICVVLAFFLFFVFTWFYKIDTVRVVGLVPLIFLLLFMLFQIIPLPASIVKILSPATYDIYAPVLQIRNDGGNWLSLSVNRRETLHELLRILSYACMYVVTLQLLSRPEKLKKAINSVIFCAAVIAFFAIIQRVSSPHKIFWFRDVPVNAIPFGPWINPNQFAGYIALLTFLAFALFLFYRPRVRSDETLREKFVNFFTMPGIHLHLFLGFATVLMVLAVFVSLCRGGILSLGLGAICFLLLHSLKFPKRGRLALFVIVFASLGAISWFGWDTVLAEFRNGFDTTGKLSDGRIQLWTDTLQIIKDFPVFGAGFGSYMSIYPLYKTLAGNAIYDHAHNDYLELFTDGGIIGFCLAAWFVVAVLWHGWKMIRVRRDQYAILLGIGAISGLVALLGHSLTDFNMHNGAIGFYFFFVCGVLVAGVNCRFNVYSPGSVLKKQSKTLNRIMAVGGFFALIVIFAVQMGSFLAGYRYNEIKDIYVNKHLSFTKLDAIASNMQNAIKMDPFEGLYSYKLGTALWYLGDKKEGLQQYLVAGKKTPLEGIFLQQIGLLVDDEEKGKALIEESYKRTLNKDSLTMSYVEWLILKERKKEALELLQVWFKQNYQHINLWMPLLNSHSLSREDMEFVLPKSVDAWLKYGKYCESVGADDDAAFFYGNAMTFLPVEKTPSPGWFNSVISYYKRTGKPDLALEYLRQAVEILPDYPGFHIMFGDYYRDEGITYRAKEEYERVLILDPGNNAARSRLRRMGFEDSY